MTESEKLQEIIDKWFDGLEWDYSKPEALNLFTTPDPALCNRLLID